MKLFSKTLARILGKENEEETMTGDAELIVFNQGEKYEFAECGNCGEEMDPDYDLCNQKLESSPYPVFCPKCGRNFERIVKAEEVLQR